METAPLGLGRDALIDAILAFLTDHDLLTLDDIRSAPEREIDEAGTDALMALRARLVADNGWAITRVTLSPGAFTTCWRTAFSAKAQNSATPIGQVSWPTHRS
jgi:hypothetical protein